MKEPGAKILYAVTSPLSLMLLRGQVRYAREAGFEAAVLTAPGPEVEAFGVQESVPVFTTPIAREISLWQDVVSLVRIWKIVRRVRPTISNAGTPKAGLLVGLSGWLNRVPVRLYTMRGLRLETARGLKRLILVWCERVACACAHRVVCVSPSLRQRAIDLKLTSPKKTVVIGAGSSNGVEAKLFEPTPERIARAAEIRRGLSISPEQRVIGYVGRLSRDKGVPELVQAFREVQDEVSNAILLLIGDNDRGDPISETAAAEIRGNPAIRQLPFQPDIAPYYLAMDVFVLPTHREGFPNTALEAQVAGCPVVTTLATGAVDAVMNEVTGLTVPVNDAGALAKAISRVLKDALLAERLAIAGQRRVLQEFQQETVWGGLVSLYRELLRDRVGD